MNPGENPPPAAAGVAGTAANASPSAAGAARASVLVVDDTPDNRDLLSRRVAQMGHAVTLAEDGRQAMELLRRDVRPGAAGHHDAGA